MYRNKYIIQCSISFCRIFRLQSPLPLIGLLRLRHGWSRAACLLACRGQCNESSTWWGMLWLWELILFCSCLSPCNLTSIDFSTNLYVYLCQWMTEEDSFNLIIVCKEIRARRRMCRCRRRLVLLEYCRCWRRFQWMMTPRLALNGLIWLEWNQKSTLVVIIIVVVICRPHRMQKGT